MDLRQYYEAIRGIEENIPGRDVLVVSEATADGGRAGMISEVTRHAAARLVVERKARLATVEEEAAFRLAQQSQTQGPTAQVQPAPVEPAITKHSASPRARKG